MDPTEASAAYNEWLASVRIGDGVSIDGVGTLLRGVFTPSLELEQILNPLRTADCAPAPVVVPPVEHHHAAHKPAHHAAHHHAAPHTVHAEEPRTTVKTYDDPSFYTDSPVYPEVPRYDPPRAAAPERTVYKEDDNCNSRNANCLTHILLIVAIVLLAAVLGLSVFNTCSHGGKRVARAAKEQIETTETVTEGVDGVMAPAETAEPESGFVSATAQKKYHLIVGSFDYPSMATETADYYRNNFPNLTVETLDNGSGRTLVSVYQSDKKSDAYNRFYRIAEQTGNWDMWVFERK